MTNSTPNPLQPDEDNSGCTQDGNPGTTDGPSQRETERVDATANGTEVLHPLGHKTSQTCSGQPQPDKSSPAPAGTDKTTWAPPPDRSHPSDHFRWMMWMAHEIERKAVNLSKWEFGKTLDVQMVSRGCTDIIVAARESIEDAKWLDEE